MSNNDSVLVYSTDGGKVEPQKQRPSAPAGDGIARIRRETKGRKGKGVTTISGLAVDESELKSLCATLKKLCGSGGAVKQFTIEIQGDHREKIQQKLQQLGYTTKLAGG